MCDGGRGRSLNAFFPLPRQWDSASGREVLPKRILSVTRGAMVPLANWPTSPLAILCVPAAGDAMVPLADIFNHKASVVELAPGYEVHGAGSSAADASDDEAGSLDVSEGEWESSGDEQEGEEGEEGSGGSGERKARDGRGSIGGEGEEEAGPSGAGPRGSDGEQGCGGGCSHHHHGHHSSHSHRATDGHEAADGEHPPAGGSGDRGSGGIMSAAAAGRPHGIYGLTAANGLHLRLEIAIVDKDDHLEIVAASAVPQGEHA